MPSSQNINNSFFEGSYKHAWKRIIPPGLTEAEVDFLQDVAGLEKGSKVLDIMCGYGRHALELARRGVNVTAIDNLPDYIDEIGQNAAEEKLPVQAMTADVLHADFGEVYDAVICMGNSFAFFDRRDAIKIITNVSNHLREGGVFIINSWMLAEIAIKYFKEKDWHYAGDYKCMLEYKYCFFPSRIESEQTIVSPAGTVETVKGVDYIFSLDELEQMLNEGGLQIREVFSTPRKKRFAFGDGRAYIVAEKLAG